MHPLLRCGRTAGGVSLFQPYSGHREDYKNIPTRIGIAGGPEKLAAIRAALRGGYVNVLITDLDTAAALLDET